MAVYRRSSRHRFILVLLVLTSVTLLTLDERSDSTGIISHVRSAARDALAPVQATVSSATSSVGDRVGTVVHYKNLRAENARLRRELDTARSQNLRNADAERERQGLLELAQMPFADDIETVAGRVLSRSPSNFQMTVEIDRGTQDGVQKGMPVATGAGLVGRVASVSGREATVVLLTDPSFNAGVRLTGSGDVGVASGSGPGQPLHVDLIELATKVGEGELVVTSGLQQSVFPPGIPVGRVRGAQADPGTLQQEVQLDPLVDVRRLQYVRVLKWTREQSTARTLQ